MVYISIVIVSSSARDLLLNIKKEVKTTESMRLKACIYSSSLCTIHIDIVQQPMVEHHQLHRLQWNTGVQEDNFLRWEKLKYIYTFFLLSPPSSKCLQRLMGNCFRNLHSVHSIRRTIFFVVFAWKQKDLGAVVNLTITAGKKNKILTYNTDSHFNFTGLFSFREFPKNSKHSWENLPHLDLVLVDKSI